MQGCSHKADYRYCYSFNITPQMHSALIEQWALRTHNVIVKLEYDTNGCINMHDHTVSAVRW